MTFENSTIAANLSLFTLLKMLVVYQTPIQLELQLIFSPSKMSISIKTDLPKRKSQTSSLCDSVLNLQYDLPI